MTLDELKREHDRYYAFSYFMTVEEAKRFGTIPKEYWDYFPNKCECGSENILTGSLQQPQCCNPKCFIKQGYALSELLTRFKCKGLGPARCIEIVKTLAPQFKYNSYIEILDMRQEDFPPALAQKAYSIDLLRAIGKIRSEKITFPTLISNLAIPTLGDKALKLLQGINNFEEFAAYVKASGSLQAFCDSRGIHDPMVFFWIQQSIVDIWLADLVMQKSVRAEGKIKIEICITGFLRMNGTRITKDEFVKLCNKVSVTEDGTQLFEVVQNTAKVGAVHIIADAPSNSAKYLAGLKRGEEVDIDGVKRSVLMSSSGFINYLEELKKKWKQKQDEINQTNSQKQPELEQSEQQIQKQSIQEQQTQESQTTKEMTLF